MKRRLAVVAMLTFVSCTSRAPTNQATPAPSPTQSVSPTPTPSPRVVSGIVSFVMPSRNIRCVLTGDAVRCDPTSYSWTLPNKPADCEFDWGGSMGVSTTGNAHFLCVSDAIPDGPVLAYGQSIRDGPIVCESSETGVKCTSQPSGHGFTVSREKYSFY